MVVESGDLLMELEVLLLQWGRALLGCPLGNCGEGLWHCGFRCGFGFGFGSGLSSGLVFSCVQCPVGYLTYCDEIGVRLMVIQCSDRAQYELTVVAWYTLVLLAGRRVLLGAHLRAPSQEVLRRQTMG